MVKRASHSWSTRAEATRSGFTIVELLIVVVVIAILAAITIVAYNGISDRSKRSAASSAAQQAAKKVVTYALQNNEQYPASMAEVALSDSGNTTYQYTRNQVGGTYCVTATVNGVSTHVGGFGQGVNPPVMGPCPGHTGVSPTKVANGSDCPPGFIVVPGNSMFNTDTFCVMKYEAKDAGGVPASTASGFPWTFISQNTALAISPNTCEGCHLTNEAERMTIAANALYVASNWSSGVVGTGYVYSGHNDNNPSASLEASSDDSQGLVGTGNSMPSNQRRTLSLSNGEVIWDFAGNVAEWTGATIAGGQFPGIVGETGFSYKQWNHPTLVWGSLPTDVRPSAISEEAAGWNSGQGIGMLFTNENYGAERAHRRGGAWTNGSGGGLLSLVLDHGPATSTCTNCGFRVSR